MLLNTRKSWMIAASICLLCGCAKQAYIAQTLDPNTTLAQAQAKSISSESFKQFAIKNGYPASKLPFATWGLEELTLSALFHHADLNVSKAKLALAEANIATAGLQTGIGINGTLARSNRGNGDISPWSYGLQLDIPIATHHKREIRMEEAQHLAEVARMDLAETAWTLRQRLSVDLINYHDHLQKIQQLQSELALYQQLTALFNKRLALGLASTTELSLYTLQQQKSLAALQLAQAQTEGILRTLATDAGLPWATFKVIPMQAMQIETILARQDHALQAQAASVQTQTLLNRIDLRRGLARYAAAESKIKLEVAKQTPDISLSPGYIFEFGDKIWSLGFASLLNLIQQQPTLIKQAELLRAVEGAQFEALQTSIVGQLSHTLAHYQATKQSLDVAKHALLAQQQQHDQLHKQFNAGLIDRVALTQSQLTLSLGAQQVHAAQVQLLRAQAEVENIMQQPLLNNQATANTAALSAQLPLSNDLYQTDDLNEAHTLPAHE
ncbi:MAG TPA: TolC family protein [Methylophilus sp.]